MLKLLTSLISVLLLAPELRAAPQFILRNSLSEQFVVYGPKASPIRHFKSDRVPLDAALVAVSCERIKQALLNQLEGTVRRQINFGNEEEGKIFVVLHPRLDQPVLITPVRTAGPLNYRIDIPNEIEATRFIDAVTETILLEIVNRHSSDRFTQIPRWLAQGLAAQVQAIAPETLVLEQHRPMMRTKIQLDPIAEIRHSTTNFSALTLDELSWPEFLSQDKTARYRPNAQLFVAELLRLKDGQTCLRQMLGALPNHPQWQVAFMQAFEPHFKRLVDLEKWWQLTVVNLTGGDLGKVLSREESIERMDAALQVMVDVLHGFGAMPERNQISLQKIISNWEPRQQEPALEKVLGQLRVLRSRVQPDISPLLDSYRQTLESYLRHDRKNFLDLVFFRGSEDLRKTTCTRLDSLDQKREKIRQERRPKPSTREEAILSALEVTRRGNQ